MISYINTIPDYESIYGKSFNYQNTMTRAEIIDHLDSKNFLYKTTLKLKLNTPSLITKVALVAVLFVIFIVIALTTINSSMSFNAAKIAATTIGGVGAVIFVVGGVNFIIFHRRQQEKLESSEYEKLKREINDQRLKDLVLINTQIKKYEEDIGKLVKEKNILGFATALNTAIKNKPSELISTRIDEDDGNISKLRTELEMFQQLQKEIENLNFS